MTNYKKELDELKTKLSALEAKINATDDGPTDDGPKEGDEYWCINSCNLIQQDRYMVDHQDDKYRIAMGNYFTSREDAETFKRVNDRAIELKEREEKLDWGDWGQAKYYLSYDHTKRKTIIGAALMSQPKGFFAPLTVFETLLKEFTNDELKIWLGVR